MMKMHKCVQLLILFLTLVPSVFYRMESKDVEGLDEDEQDETIILVSKEKQRIPVKKTAAMRSTLIKTTLDGGHLTNS